MRTVKRTAKEKDEDMGRNDPYRGFRVEAELAGLAQERAKLIGQNTNKFIEEAVREMILLIDTTPGCRRVPKLALTVDVYRNDAPLLTGETGAVSDKAVQAVVTSGTAMIGAKKAAASLGLSKPKPKVVSTSGKTS